MICEDCRPYPIPTLAAYIVTRKWRNGTLDVDWPVCPAHATDSPEGLFVVIETEEIPNEVITE